jgi:hypothetical protein
MKYTNEYGVKTSKNLDKIILAAQNHTKRSYKGNVMFCDFLGTKRMQDLRSRFEAEAEAIGGVEYNFGDCLA